MFNCPGLSSTSIGNTGTTWGEADRTALRGLSVTTYFRPDVGAALLPWIFTIIVIIVHAPVIFIRVVRWDIAQNWCLVSTLFTIGLYILAYVSTGLEAEQILVWTPLILVIDGGSMLQLVFLVLEAKPVLVEGRVYLFDPPQGGEVENEGMRLRGVLRRLFSRTEQAKQEHELEEIAPEESAPEEIAPEEIAPNPPPTPPENYSVWTDHAAYAVGFSAIFFVCIVVLQLIGLRAAIAARSSGHSPLVRWCSPAFQPFGVALVDGDCHVYEVLHSLTLSIGCIQIPGIWQGHWLTITVVGTIIGLICQFVDLVILWKVNGTQAWRGLKMKRPWATMIFGVVTLGITLFYSLQYSSMLPPGITERVTIAVDIDGVKTFQTLLTNAGLRGTIIGWIDGVFSSLKDVYYLDVIHDINVDTKRASVKVKTIRSGLTVYK